MRHFINKNIFLKGQWSRIINWFLVFLRWSVSSLSLISVKVTFKDSKEFSWSPFHPERCDMIDPIILKFQTHWSRSSPYHPPFLLLNKGMHLLTIEETWAVISRTGLVQIDLLDFFTLGVKFCFTPLYFRDPNMQEFILFQNKKFRKMP